MAPQEKGRQSDPIPKAILCQDISEPTSDPERLEFSKLANGSAVDAAVAVEPLVYWVLA
jgi:hypothetical protein